MKKIYLTLALIASLIFTVAPAYAKSKKRSFTKHEQAILYLVLQNTNEVRIHQMGGKSGNQVFLGPDGHKEAVYNAAGKLVRDGINDGSYNYNHPAQEPILHFGNDIHPWIMMGMSRSDTTTTKKRIYAYMGDLEGGIRNAQKQRDELGKLEQGLTLSKEQTQILSVWENALAKKEAYAIFAYFNLDRDMTDKEMLTLMKAIYKGFKSAY